MSILMDMLLKSTLLLGVAWMATLALRRGQAAARHVIWAAALAAIALLPLMTTALPSIHVPLPDAAVLAGAPMFRATAAASGAASAATTSPSAPSTTPAPRSTSIAWASLLPRLWAVGVLCMLLHLAFGYARMAWLRRRARAIDRADVLDELSYAAGALGVTRPVALLESDLAGVPMASGILDACICLPAAARDWESGRLRSVLLHEMAHILRRDPLTHLAARLVLCLYWFHPLAWMAMREFLRERERASDDLVLVAGERPSDYAGHLLGVAASMTPAPAGWASVCMARPSQLERRLVAILDARTRRGTVGPVFAASAAVAAVLLVTPLAVLSLQGAAAEPATAAEMEALIRAANSARDHAMIERTMTALIEKHRWKEAQQLADAALQIRGERYGTTSKEYAKGLIQQGEARRAAGQWEDAANSYRQAAELLQGGDTSTLGFFATTALGKREYERAAGLFERALALDPDSAQRARLLTGLAFAREQLKDTAAAERHYLDAVHTAPAESGDQATALELYSRFLSANNRGEEAQPLQEQAKKIRIARVGGELPTPPVLKARVPTFRVGGGVLAPRLLYKVEPVYSEEARTAKYQGTVVLYVEVGPDGLAHNIRLVRGLGLGLDERAVEAVRQWRFNPGTKDGQPVTVAATIEVNFRLQ